LQPHRAAELRAQLRGIDRALAVLERQALELRKRYSLHMNRFCRIIRMEAALADSPSVQAAWRGLQKR
jgi:hypothetical protein